MTSKEGNLNEKAPSSLKGKGGSNTLLSSQKVIKRGKDGKRGSDPRVEANKMIKKIMAGEKNVMAKEGKMPSDTKIGH